MLRAATRLAGPLLFYGAVVCWLTWPLAARVGTHLPAAALACSFDSLYTAWALAWETHAIGSSASLLDANIYHPSPHALLYGPPAIGAVPFFLAVYGPTGNPTLALNLLFLGSAVLGALLVHVVTRRWTGLGTAGVVAACTFLASRWLFWDFAVTSPQFAMVFYLPLIVDRLCRARQDRRALGTLFLLVLAQGLTDVVYLAPAALAPMVVIGSVRLARGRTRANGLAVLAVAGVAVLVLVAVHWPWFAFARATPSLASQSFWAGQGNHASYLPWSLFGMLSPVAVPTVALALIALGAATALGRRWRGASAERDHLWKHAAVWAGVGTAISLRPRVAWNGRFFALPPLALAHAWVPALSFMRLPERLAVAAWVGLALLAGLAFAELVPPATAWIARPARARVLQGTVAIALAIAMYVQYSRGVGQHSTYGTALPPAYPLQEAVRGDSTVLRVLRATGGPTLELPLDPFAPAQPAYQAAAMYRSMFHWQPLLNGYSSYWPREFPGLMALVVRLPDPGALEELQRRTGLRFILIRLAHEVAGDAKYDSWRDLWRGFATRRDRPDLELLAADDELMLFRIIERRAPAPSPSHGPDATLGSAPLLVRSARDPSSISTAGGVASAGSAGGSRRTIRPASMRWSLRSACSTRASRPAASSWIRSGVGAGRWSSHSSSVF